MHDTARSAWRASKQFASSVITGGVGLSACRTCNRRQSSSSGNRRGSNKKSKKQSGESDTDIAGPQQQGCRGAQVSPGKYDSCAQQAADLVIAQTNSVSEDDQHTSVIEVQSSQPNCSANRLVPCSASGDQVHQNESLINNNNNNNRNSQMVQHLQHETSDQQQSSSLIRVDENNKLTIVTKFNESECNNQSPNNSASLDLAASSSSERSRCESSSSGRGTSSDAGSATASQNGDMDMESHPGQTAALPVSHDPSLNHSNNDKEVTAISKTPVVDSKRHKRKASLFKASKVFGGSQASLNKLKSFFTGSSSGKVALSNGNPLRDQLKDSQQALDGRRDHLDSSRLRCLELNQNNRASSIDPDRVAAANEDLNQVGQGGSDEAERQNLSEKLNASFSMMRDGPHRDNIDQQQEQQQQQHLQQQQVSATVVPLVGS